MSPHRILLGLGGAVGLVFAATLGTRAAPFVPGRPPLPAEVMSLADLAAARLEVSDVPALFQEAGVTKEIVESLIREKLTGGALELQDGPDLPVLMVKMAQLTDENQPDAVGVYLVLGLHQAVTVHRLNRAMTVPTATLATGRLVTRADVGPTLKRELGLLVDRLVRYVRRASEVAAEPAGEQPPSPR